MMQFKAIANIPQVEFAFHPHSKGIIQFIGAFIFGSCPKNSYKYLLKNLYNDLYNQGYSLVIYKFPCNPLQFNHWSVAINLLISVYQARVGIIKELHKNNSKELEFYANDENYYWLGHSLGCKYILLLELLSDNDISRRDAVLQSSLREKYLSNAFSSISRADSARTIAQREITNLLKKPCSLEPFIRNQPSLLLAPEINNSVQILNFSVSPSSRLGFPNRREMQNLIINSSQLFKLMGIISFTWDGIARDDVEFLRTQLRCRKFLPFLHKVFFGWHFTPQGVHVEKLVSCIDLILHELRQRQLKGIAQAVQCEDQQSCYEGNELKQQAGCIKNHDLNSLI